MLQEGYMLQLENIANQQWYIREKIQELIGPERTTEFYDSWLANHLRKSLAPVSKVAEIPNGLFVTPVLPVDNLKAMSMALEDVCAALKIPPDAGAARETIAIHIIDLARAGERSPTKLRDRVLAEANGGTGL